MVFAMPLWAQEAVKVDSDTISGLGARNIGSATMSGRIAAIDAVNEGKRVTVYVGAASGGVWRSINGGTTFKPVFDKQPVQSIGAVAIDRKNPKTVWVGTGESWTRNSVSVGDGIYKTTDGGDNWTNMGLKESERISKILIDPNDSNTVYVCVPGKLWSDSDERGVFKTSDGGKTWSKILKGANGSTGCGIMSMDPKDPKVLYASLWDFRRKGWTFRSGGENETAFSGSGLFKSTDAGASWTELEAQSAKGLPAKPWGRVAVTVAPSNSNVVYAAIEAKIPTDGLYRSDDGGKTWDKRDRSQFMIWRPFYFANLIVDPKDENKVFKVNLGLILSTDGGKTFSNVSGATHGDYHTVWINPENPEHVIAGDDGGLWISHDGGNRWWKSDNLPVSQFYHVSADMDRPYKVYGGLQDNSSWVGDSQYPGGITNSRWENLYGGDGFWVFTDPSDPDYVYAEFQGGFLGRVNRKTHEARIIQPQALPDFPYGTAEKKLRWNWNTPIHLSPNEKGTIYIGSQFLFRSRDHGASWDRISPDLSTNDPEKQKQEQSGGITVDNSAAEMHTTIYSISESPKNVQVIWAGTDDGNVQVTRDGGKNWSNVTGNVPDVPKASWVSWVEASPHDEGTAFVAFDRHTFGDMSPHVYRTTDYGKTWKRIVAGEAGVQGYAHVIKQDPVAPGLLYLGTEFGLWITLDGGQQWAQYKGGDFPAAAVRDLVVHPRDHDLILGTHGRGIWIVDDIAPLRNLTQDNLTKDAVFVDGRAQMQAVSNFSGGWAEGDAKFSGQNATEEMVITYYQKKRHIRGDLKLEIFDDQGKLLNTVPGSKRRGLSRATWDMRLIQPKLPTAASSAGFAGAGPRVLPGTYTVKMTKDKDTYTTKITVGIDPRAPYNAEDRKVNFALAMRLYNMLGDMTFTADRIKGVLDAANEALGKLDAKDPNKARMAAFVDAVGKIRKEIVATKEGGAITGEERIREKLAELYGTVALLYEGRPTKQQSDRADAMAADLADVGKRFDALLAKDLPALNKGLEKKKLKPITAMTRGDWEKKDAPKVAGGAKPGEFDALPSAGMNIGELMEHLRLR
ncbi:MAG: sialidase [Acidobacteriales bacterium]|nr:sialidase [Terriglobales bacterium]